MASLSQTDFLSGDHSWEKAYFTTYALSLTFFESYLLSHLRKAGCENVTVLVDSEGYRASLMEMKSRSIGQEYALIPVQCAANGIFHPKITYLWGRDGDLLLIGSGNLTFGGHGRNIEVLEVLTPQTDSYAYADFADFLDALIASDSVTIAKQEELSELAGRVRNQIDGIALGGPTRLLHTLEMPILDQLVVQLGTGGGWQELLCLSPYHHPSAQPVRRLVDELGIQSLKVGVAPSPGHPTSFPIDEAQSWGIDVSTVAPKVEKPNRPVHAKWFEFRGPRCMTLTGSVNATEHSLATTKNVEVSVLRTLDAPESDQWKKAKKTTHVPNDFSGIGKARDLVVHAALSASGSIQGKILGQDSLAGLWSIWLRVGDELGPREEVHVEDDGSFDWSPPKFNEFDVANAVQVNLSREGTLARGWVSFQSILRLPLRSRAAQAAIARMLARDDATDDSRVILDYIAFHSNKVLRVQPSAGKKSGKEAQEELPDERFSVTDLVLTDDQSSTSLLRDLAKEAVGRNRSWKTLSVIARLLAGKKVATGTGVKGRGGRSARAEQLDDESVLDVQDALAALRLFNDKLYEQFSGIEEENGSLVPLLVVWLNVNLDMRLRQLSDAAGAFNFCDQWIRRAVYAPIPDDYRDGSDDSVYGVAAALAWQTRALGKQAVDLHEGALSRRQIHEWLETYVGGEVDNAAACEAANRWFQTSMSQMLVEGGADSAVEALASVLREPTARTCLAQVVAAHEGGRSVEVPADFFRPSEEQLVRAIARSGPNRARCRTVERNAKGCPSCRFNLHTDERAMLRTRRITRCMQCKMILVMIEP